MSNYVNVLEELMGATLTEIINCDDAELRFLTADKEYRMFHYQDCCESVWIEDICGDLEDLVGHPILQAEEVVCCEQNDVPEKELVIMLLKGDDLFSSGESETWTFYKFATIKGSVTIRWCGQSNGYYSESVDFQEIK